MTILIPAYKPDERLIQLVKDLLAQSDYAIVVESCWSHKK